MARSRANTDGRQDFATRHPMIIAQQAMDEGERLVWADRGQSSGKQRWIGVLFGLAFAGFALVWMALAAGIAFGGRWPTDDWIGSLFPLFGVPFVIVGLSVSVKAFRGGGNAPPVYAASDRRLIVMKPPAGAIDRSIDLAWIDTITPNAGPDGSGTLKLDGSTDQARAVLTGVPRVKTVAEEIKVLRARVLEDRAALLRTDDSESGSN